MKNSILFMICLSVVLSTTTSFADQVATCKQKGGVHQAIYRCIEGYEVNYIGSGEYECDGGCFKEGDKKSFRDLLVKLISNRVGRRVDFSEDEINTIYGVFRKEGRFTIRFGQQEIIINGR